jgi:hypothetical protein
VKSEINEYMPYDKNVFPIILESSTVASCAFIYAPNEEHNLLNVVRSPPKSLFLVFAP